MFSRSQLVTFFLTISGGCLRVTPLSLMECLCSAPRICHKSQLISPHKCHSSLPRPSSHHAVIHYALCSEIISETRSHKKLDRLFIKPQSRVMSSSSCCFSRWSRVNLNPQSFTLIVVINLNTLALRLRHRVHHPGLSKQPNIRNNNLYETKSPVA